MKKLYTLLGLLYLPLPLYAQFREIGRSTTDTQSAISLFSVLGDIVLWLCGLGILLALINLPLMGIWYLTSEGDENRNAKAKEVALFNAILLITSLIIFGLIFTFGK